MEIQDSKTWLKLIPLMGEHLLRLYVAQKAIELKHGGITAVHRLTGISQTTISAGIKELTSRKQIKPNNRTRAPGGGRKSIHENQPELKKSLIKILEETTVGDPMSALRWTSKSLTNIKDVLTDEGFAVSRQTVHGMLKEEGYRLRGNMKTIEGKQHPDRDKQFEYINDQCAEFFLEKCPVISVDTKKKELVGNFKNPGKELCKKDDPTHVNTYDFPNLADGKAIPYGSYDIARNEAFVNVGTSHDTPEFAVTSITNWWKEMGSAVYPAAKKLLICADGGGSNSSKSRMWKANLQEFSDKENIEITVCHFPPGTSKWNKIEHRLFSFISMNWRGKPLVNYETIVNLIANTKTKKGLFVKSSLDKSEYKTGEKISNLDFENLSISYHVRDCRWNYTISPRNVSV